MAESRVVVAGVALRGRRLATVGVDGCRVVTSEHHVLAGAGAMAAVAAAAAGRRVHVGVDLVARVGDDAAGMWCLAELIGRGVDVAGVGRWGTTGEYLVLESPTGAEEVVLAPGDVDASAVGAAVARCVPGDVLLLDALMVAHHPEIVEDAYDRDLQIVLDLAPVVPGALTPEIATRVDVAVVDTGGAGALADSASQPATVAVYGAGLGSWWDDLRHRPQTPRPAAGPSDDGVHRFAGALAAGLASGLDRPEAFSLAVSVATERIEA